MRKYQVVGLVHLALVAWTGLYVYTPRNYTGGIEVVLADPTDGGFGDRFYSAVVAVLAWGHVPAVYLLAVYGVVLAIGSIRTGGRAPYDPGRIPTEQLFWWSLAMAGMIRAIAGSTVGAHRFMDSPYYGASFGAFWVWLAIAVAAVVFAAARALRGIPSPDRVAGQARVARLLAQPPGKGR